MLSEGSSIRGIERVTGVNRNTIMNLGLRVGNACRTVLDERMRNLGCKDFQVDEWDIGAAAPATSPASLEAISWVCAWWTVGAGVVIIGVRFLVHHHRWFVFTGAALLHVVLHGLIGVSYLVAGAIAAILAAVAVTTGLLRSGRRKATTGGSR